MRSFIAALLAATAFLALMGFLYALKMKEDSVFYAILWGSLLVALLAMPQVLKRYIKE